MPSATDILTEIEDRVPLEELFDPDMMANLTQGDLMAMANSQLDGIMTMGIDPTSANTAMAVKALLQAIAERESFQDIKNLYV